MALDRVTARFMNDNEQAQKSARANLNFVIQYKKYLTARDSKAAQDLTKLKTEFTPKQMRYIENMYEKVMGELGFGRCRNKSKYNQLKDF